MALQDAGAEAEPQAKQPRVTFRDFDDYAQDVLGKAGCLVKGDDVDVEIKEDVIEEADGYSDIITRIVNDVRDQMAGIDIKPKVRTALVILRFLCEGHAWEKSVLNDCLLSKVLLGDDARAHIDGIYITVFGVWRRQRKFTLKHVRDMTDVMLLVRSYLSTLIEQDVGSSWEDAAGHLKANPPILAEGESYDKDCPAAADGETTGRWRARLKTIMRYQSDFLGNQGKLDHIISTMVNYFQEPREQQPVVSLLDACLRLHWGKSYEQIKHAASNNCYIRIPAQITQKFSEADERRQDLFIAIQCQCLHIDTRSSESHSRAVLFCQSLSAFHAISQADRMAF